MKAPILFGEKTNQPRKNKMRDMTKKQFTIAVERNGMHLVDDCLVDVGSRSVGAGDERRHYEPQSHTGVFAKA